MAAVTLPELINHVGVDDKALNERCSEEHINVISQYLPWKLVAPHLLLTETDINDIDRDGREENDKRQKALQTWKERQAFKATYKMLIEGLLTTGRATCAESVCNLLKGVHHGLARERNPVQPHSDNSSSGFSSNGSDKEDSASALSTQFSGSPTLLPACNCGKCSVYSSLSMPCLHPHSHDVVPVWSDDETKHNSGQLTKYGQFEYKCELEKHTDVIARRFTRLQRATCKSFKRCNVSPQGILLYLKSLRTFRPVRTCTQSLLAQRMSELGRAQNMKEIFDVLSDYWSWYNYTLLEDLIKKFGKNQDKERLDEFKDELEEFLNFRAKKPESMTFGEGDESSCHVLLVKVDKNWDDIPLHQVDSIHNTVADILGLEKRALFLCSVRRGCILLRFLVPPCVPKLAFPLKPSQKEALKAAGVMLLKCERHRYEFPSTHYSQSAQADDSTDIHITEQDLDEGSGNSSGVEADFSDTSVIQNDTKCNMSEDDEVAAHNSTAVDLTGHKKGKLQTLRTQFGDRKTESDSGGGVELQRNNQRHRGHLLYLLMGLFGLFALLLLLGRALWVPGGSTIAQPRGQEKSQPLNQSTEGNSTILAWDKDQQPNLGHMKILSSGTARISQGEYICEHEQGFGYLAMPTPPAISNKVMYVQLGSVAEIRCDYQPGILSESYSTQWVREEPNIITLTPENLPASPHRMISLNNFLALRLSEHMEHQGGIQFARLHPFHSFNEQPRIGFTRIGPDLNTIRLTCRTSGGSPINNAFFRRYDEVLNNPAAITFDYRLSADKEGSFTCEQGIGGVRSEMLQLFAMPTPPAISNKVMHVQLGSVAEIRCDYQPGILLESYSTQWVREEPNIITLTLENLPASPHRMISLNNFSLLVNIENLTQGQQHYQCTVPIESCRRACTAQSFSEGGAQVTLRVLEPPEITGVRGLAVTAGEIAEFTCNVTVKINSVYWTVDGIEHRDCNQDLRFCVTIDNGDSSLAVGTTGLIWDEETTHLTPPGPNTDRHGEDTVNIEQVRKPVVALQQTQEDLFSALAVPPGSLRPPATSPKRKRMATKQRDRFQTLISHPLVVQDTINPYSPRKQDSLYL